MARNLATLEEVAQPGEYNDDYEMTTSALGSGKLVKPRPTFGVDDWDMVPDADWLLRLTGSLRTAELDDEDAFIPESQQSRFAVARSGMSAHSSAIRIIPTKGARFTTGLRRGVLLALLGALGVALVGGAGYLLAETAWLSNLFTTPAPAQAQPPPASAQVQTEPQVLIPLAPLPDIRDSRPPVTQPAQPQAVEPAIPVDMQEAALAGTDALSLRERGVQAYKAGDYAQAASLLEQSVALNADDAVAEYQLGMAYMSITGREHALDDAELAFRTATSLQPDWAAASQMLAETFIRRGFYTEAIPFALDATRIDPTMSEAWLTLSRAYTGAGMEEEASGALNEAAKYAPER